MKEAIILVPGFGSECQDFYLDNFLTPGLLTLLEDVEVTLDPQAVKIPGQAGKRFQCQVEDEKKTLDIYEVYWDDLVDHLSAKNARQKLARGLNLFIYMLVSGWKIIRISPIFFIQSCVILVLVAAWYYGIVILVLASLAEQNTLQSIEFLQRGLNWMTAWATEGWGWQLWLLISALLAILPTSISLIIDLIDFFVRYLQNESSRGRPPRRAVLRTRLKQAVDNVLAEPSYDRITIVAHSIGCLIATDFLADYQPRSDRAICLVTWGSALASSTSVSTWVSSEIKKCLDNPLIEQWDDFYSHQDWFCSQVPLPNGTVAPKLISREASFRVSLLKQLSGESHGEYFYDPKVLRHLVLGATLPVVS
ncbi:hypothetical protein [Halomicronema sp. CCY15110]|uniref:hypothetical protein n=1 Tax=Halomicronema sp. CCY15110 TaxID=2767773 RepID=UPI00194E3198|nr:hypothetical protein [Halomicronema sp. CCY15110]